MSRPIDAELENRILQAARKLWHQGGEAALSMRAVAKAAGSNTPAVYRRFRSREEILRALVRAYQQQLYEQLVPCLSLTDVAEAFLQFALRHPREYELIMSGLLARMTDERPNLELLAQRCAQWFGGRADAYQPFVLAVAALAHGTAMLGISGVVPQKDFASAKAAFIQAVAVLAQGRKNIKGVQGRRPASNNQRRRTGVHS